MYRKPLGTHTHTQLHLCSHKLCIHTRTRLLLFTDENVDRVNQKKEEQYNRKREIQTNKQYFHNCTHTNIVYLS